jgi:hypothetical protein
MDASAPPEGAWTPVGNWTLDGAASIDEVRRRVAAVAGEHDVDRPQPEGAPLLAATPERLALVCAELAANGIRYGSPPVTVALARGDGSWLIVVSDRYAVGGAEDTGRQSAPPDPGEVGGTGLALVVAASEQVGWYVTGPIKHVWAELADRPPECWMAALRGVPRHVPPTPLPAPPGTA